MHTTYPETAGESCLGCRGTYADRLENQSAIVRHQTVAADVRLLVILTVEASILTSTG
jgi:hypothetical protein